MRKSSRNRKQRREPSQPSQEQPLQPDSASEGRSEEASLTETARSEGSQPEAAEKAAPKTRGRTRRRRKKPPLHEAEIERTGADALVPAYSETEGPRATFSPVTLKPGAPTGEAAELEMPAEVPAAPAPAPQPAAPQAPKRASKGAVVLSVGLPGSGKTTWFKRKGVTPLSSDLLRTLLFDDPTEQRHQDLVFSSLRSLLRARMIARMPANYVDATNLSPKERRHWIRMAREFGYEVHAVYFDVPLETCMERNRKRQRVVPEDVMQRMAAKLRPPSFEEGFAKIIVVRVKHRAAEGEPAETAATEPAVEPEVEQPTEPTPESQPQMEAEPQEAPTEEPQSVEPAGEESHQEE
jgi:predicted kinase